MIEIKKHCIAHSKTISDALLQLNELGQDLTLFVIKDDVLVGTVTDGDIRRGLLKRISLDDSIESVMFAGFSSICEGKYTFNDIERIRNRGINILPVVDDRNKILKLLNLSELRTILPIDVVIMAGGEGRRLRPLTETTPKPLLSVGDKPILEHNIDRLINFGVENFWISIRYLGEKIEAYFNDGSKKGIKIVYIREDEPLGTIGALNKISEFSNAHVLISNSDILTGIDYQDFYMDFLATDADLSVVTIPYTVNIPYGVLETSNGHIVSFKEKPTYTYHSNGGIYLIKKHVLDYIPQGFFNATDLMELLINKGHKVTSYSLRNYWLDIGNPEDFRKANEDIKHLRF